MKNKNLKKLNASLKKQLKNFKPSKTLIAIIAALIGIGGTLLAQSIAKENNTKITYHLTSPHQERHYHPRHAFEDDFFSHSIFGEIHQIQREMDQAFARQRARMDRIFSETSQNINNYNSNSATITKEETEKNYIYKLNFLGYKKEDIKIEIRNQTLNISANNSQSKEHSQNSSNFYYSFYIPKYNSNTKPIIERKEGNITITLQK